MKKNMIKKALALLVILAMMIPFMPVIASADATYQTKLDGVTAVDAYEWFKTNCDPDGDGTYEIDSTEDLAYFMACGRGTSSAAAASDTNVTFKNETVVLTRDIPWNEGTASSSGFVTKDGSLPFLWEPYFGVGTQYAATYGTNGFLGTFDGQGYTISGLYIMSIKSKNVGFFAGLSGAKVSNVRFENCYVSGPHSNDSFLVGMVAGAVCATSKFENILVSNCHLTGAMNVGGIIGGSSSNMNYASVKISLTNCVIDENSTVTATTSGAGGIIGVIRGNNGDTLTRCFSYATVTVPEGAIDNRNTLIGYDASTKTVTDDCATFDGMYYYSGTGATAGTALAPTAPDNAVMTIEGTQVRAPYKNTADVSVFDARIVASVDLDDVVAAADVTEVGFQLAKIGEYVADNTNLKEQACKAAYKSIKAKNATFTDVSVGTGEGQIDADYLTTLVIQEIPAEGTFTILVRAYYKTAEGTFYGGFSAVTFTDGVRTGALQLA